MIGGFIFYALALDILFVLVAALGLLWAPFGALAYVWIAKSKGVPVAPNALRGLVYSMLLFFPWAYFAIRMDGRQIPTSCIVTGYVALYAGWFAILFTRYFYMSTNISGPHGFLALLHATLLIVSIVQFHCVSPYTQSPRGIAYLRYTRLAPFFYMSIGLYIHLFYNLVTAGSLWQ